MQLLLLFIIVRIIMTITLTMLMLTVLTAIYNRLMTNQVNNTPFAIWRIVRKN